MTLQLIHFRSTEENRVFAEVEKIDLQLTQAKLELSRQQMEIFVATIFEEILTVISSTFGDIWVVLLWSRIFLLCIIAVITIVEVLQSLHLIIKKLSTKQSRFVVVSQSTKSRFLWGSKSPLLSIHETANNMLKNTSSHVIFNTQESKLLQPILSTFYLSLTTQNSTFLPVVLLQGPVKHSLHS